MSGVGKERNPDMQFSCGRTHRQKRKDSIQALEERHQRLSKWHWRFALLPVSIGERNGRKICIWMQWYERKLKDDINYPYMIHHSSDFDYRLPETKEN